MTSLTKIAQASFSTEMQKLALKGTGAFAKALAKRSRGISEVPYNPKAISSLLARASGNKLSEKIINQPVVSQMLYEAKTKIPDDLSRWNRRIKFLRQYWNKANPGYGSLASKGFIFG